MISRFRRIASRLAPRERVVLVAGTCIIALSIAYAEAVRPFARAAASRKELLLAERDAVARQLDVMADSARIMADLRSALAVLEQARPRLFASPEEEGGRIAAIAAAGAYVDSLAAQSGIRLDRMDVVPDSASSDNAVLTRVDVTIGAAATLPALAELIHSVQSAARLVRVSRLRFLGPAIGAGGIPGLINFEIELDMYIMSHGSSGQVSP